MIPITRRASHLTEVHAFFLCAHALVENLAHTDPADLTEADLVVGWLTLIPQISLISLWVENLTEVGGVLGCMGFQITLSSLSAPSTPSAPSSPFTKAK